ncbi:MAG: HAMP domain-containing protein [Bacteroidetes bacterium]|nr:HAMP domain-containing protein [Bacteroidota bacterium]
MIIFSGMMLFSVRLWMVQTIDTDIMDHTEVLWRKIQRSQVPFDSLGKKKDIQYILNSESNKNRFLTWIINPDSMVVAHSYNIFQVENSLTTKLPVRILSDRPQFTEIPTLGFTHRCVSFPIIKTPDSTAIISFENNTYPIVGWVITASSSVPVNDFINSLTRVLIGMIVICIIIASAFALVLSELALRPLTEIVATARSITVNQLSTRIKPTEEQDEVGQLVTTLNHLFDRLEASFEQIRQFTADASHELLTPLTIIKGELELALSRDREGEYYKMSLGNALVQANQLILITQTLLKLSREEKSTEKLDFEILDIRIIVNKLFKQLVFLADQKSIRLTESLEESLPLINTNENLLHTLLFNLIENAIKYSPPKTKVIIKSRKHPVTGRFTIDVIDHGLGIPDEEKRNIFLRFYRIEKSRAKVTGGSGLGLSLVSKIRELLNLDIEVTNNKPMGTIFSVSFPDDSVFN